MPWISSMEYLIHAVCIDVLSVFIWINDRRLGWKLEAVPVPCLKLRRLGSPPSWERQPRYSF